MRSLIPLVAAAALAGCAKNERASHQLDVGEIEVINNARLRTDTVGLLNTEEGLRAGGKPTFKQDQTFASVATFVLVDAKNPTPAGAYVTLAGELTGEGGKVVGKLKAQSLWIPSHETRTFALIDEERVPRPDTTSARIVVTGALVTHDGPRAHVDDLHTFVDPYTENGKPVTRIVAQANIVNDANRIGRAIIIASFHGADGRPITRPFLIAELHPNATGPVQFVGPPGSVDGTIFIGDIVY